MQDLQASSSSSSIENYVDYNTVNSYLQQTYSGKVYDQNGRVVDYVFFDKQYYDSNKKPITLTIPDYFRNDISNNSNWGNGNRTNDASNNWNWGRTNDASNCSFNFENMSLDEYISNYYKRFWNENRKMYSDDYILKTEIVPMSCPTCPFGNYGDCKCPKTDNDDKAKTQNNNLFNINPVPSLNLPNPSLNLPNPSLNLPNPSLNLPNITVPPLPSNPLTTITPTPLNQPNGRGLSGNYNGDNTSSNTGYLSGKDMFPTPNLSLASVENNFNAVPSKGDSSNYLPIVTDFSKFGR